MDVINMTCKNCGGKIQINKDADQVLCQFCGSEYLLSFNEGAVSIKFLSEGIKKIAISTDKTASELALIRIKKEKESLVTLFGEITESLSTISGKMLIDSEMDRLQSGDIKFEPALFRANCEKMIKREERAIFGNDSYLKDLKIIHTELSVLEKKDLELKEMEKYHLGIVNSK